MKEVLSEVRSGCGGGEVLRRASLALVALVLMSAACSSEPAHDSVDSTTPSATTPSATDAGGTASETPVPDPIEG